MHVLSALLGEPRQRRRQKWRDEGPEITTGLPSHPSTLGHGFPLCHLWAWNSQRVTALNLQFDLVMRKEPVIQEWLEVSTMQGVRDVLPKISSWCVVPVYSFLSTLPSRAFFIPSTSYLHHHLCFYIPASTKTLNQKDFTRFKPWMGLTKLSSLIFLRCRAKQQSPSSSLRIQNHKKLILIGSESRLFAAGELQPALKLGKCEHQIDFFFILTRRPGSRPL